MRLIDTYAVVDAPPHTVWESLTDFDSYPQWNPMFTRVDGIPEAGQRLRLHTAFPFRRHPMIFTVTVRTVEAPLRLVWGGGFAVPGIADGEHGFELVPTHGGGTRLRHYERLTGLLPTLGRPLLRRLEQRYSELNAALRDHACAHPQP